MIYFPVDNIPSKLEDDLFLALSENKAEGTLVPYLCGFLN